MKVRIYKPTKTATQSGLKNTKLWLMEVIPDHQTKSINSLTGWTSSNDTKDQLKLKFNSKDEAIKYAADQGFEYEIFKTKTGSIKKKSYASNFV